MEVKRAQLHATEVELTLAQQRARTAGGPEAIKEAAALEARLLVKRAELKEPEVRLKQARRRLENLKKQAEQDERLGRARTTAESLFSSRDIEVTVLPGQRTRFRIAFENKTRETFHIAAVRTSAGFVRAQAQLDSVTPGQASQLDVDVDPSRLSGPKTAFVYVQFDQPWHEAVTLRIKINVPERVGDQPAAALDQPPANGRRTDSQKRLADLEKKLESLMKEIESLRKELRQPQSALPQPGQPLLPQPNANGVPELPKGLNVVPIVPGNPPSTLPRPPANQYRDPRTTPTVPLTPPPENTTPRQ